MSPLAPEAFNSEVLQRQIERFRAAHAAKRKASAAPVTPAGPLGGLRAALRRVLPEKPAPLARPAAVPSLPPAAPLPPPERRPVVVAAANDDADEDDDRKDPFGWVPAIACA